MKQLYICAISSFMTVSSPYLTSDEGCERVKELALRVPQNGTNPRGTGKSPRNLMEMYNNIVTKPDNWEPGYPSLVDMESSQRGRNSCKSLGLLSLWPFGPRGFKSHTRRHLPHMRPIRRRNRLLVAPEEGSLVADGKEDDPA